MTKKKQDKSGYCELCDCSVKDMYQHVKTKKHIKNTEVKNEHSNDDRGTPKGDKEREDDNNIKSMFVQQEDEQEEINKADNEFMDTQNDSDNRNYQIQIIGENTGKKQKGTIDSILETVFSEQFAPVTMSILNNFAFMVNQKFSPTGNEAKQEGNIVELVGGGKITVPNPNF